MTETHYDVLDISPDATEEEIKRAYQQKMKEQSGRSNDSDTHTDMRIRAAKETLLDSQARQRYDRVHDIHGSKESSEETGTWTDRALIKQILDSVARLRTAPERCKQWVRVRRLHATDISEVVTSPTVIRLAVTVVLSLVVMWMIRRVNTVSPAIELGVVLVSLCTSYLGYSILSPLPFEKPRIQAQFTPTPMALWPVLLVYGVGLSIHWAATLTGTSSGEIHYAFMVVLYALSVCIGGIIIGVPVGMLLGRAIPLWRSKPFRELQSGIALGLLGSAIVLFTSVGGDSTLSAFIETVGSNQGILWLPTLRVGPLHLGSLLNFGLAAGMWLCLAVGIVGALWGLTTVPWQDRYEYGYRVLPTVWNLFVIVPFVAVVWMWVRGEAVLSVPIRSVTVELLRPDVTGGFLVALPLLVGVYLLRRRLEPQLHHK